MAQWKAFALLLLVACAAGASVAERVSEVGESERELVGAGGQQRGLRGILLKKLLKKKLVVGAAKLLLAKALLVKAKLMFLKFKALGLAALLSGAGIEEPEDVVYETDLGSACNVALDVGVSCAELAKDEPREVQKALHKMSNVVYYVEEKVEHVQTVHYLDCVVEEADSGDSVYYVLKDDGTKTPYHPAHGDEPVEYVIVHADGSTEPYYGAVHVVTADQGGDGVVLYDIHTEDGSQGDQHVQVVLPHGVEVTDAEQIAVDVEHSGRKTEYLRYQPQDTAGVDDTEAIAEFKMRLLETVSGTPEFEQRDGIYVAKMVTR